ncbi:MAG: hypothetical protein KIS66_04940 [Fimbriimonadaceae bacterium]|nr:hypothetical protein [Fimbriimonadaceae bacterium]
MRVRAVVSLLAVALVASGSAQNAFWTRGIPFTVEMGRDGWIRPSATLTAPGLHGPITLDFSGLRRHGNDLLGRFRFESAGHSLCGLRMDIVGVSESRAGGERAYPSAAAEPLFLGDAPETQVKVEIPAYAIRNTPFAADTRTITVRGVLSGWLVEPDIEVKARDTATCLNDGKEGRFWLGSADLDLATGVATPAGPAAMAVNSVNGSVWQVTPDGRARLVGSAGTEVDVSVGPIREQRQVRADDNGFLVVGSDNGIVRKVRRDGTVEWQTDLGATGAIPITTGPKGRTYAVRPRDGAVEMVAIEDNGATVRVVTTSRSKGVVRIQAPVAIRTDPIGYLHALERRRDSLEIRVFDPMGGVVRSTGHMGRFRDGGAKEPLDLAFSPDGSLHVLFRNEAGTMFVRTYKSF